MIDCSNSCFVWQIGRQVPLFFSITPFKSTIIASYRLGLLQYRSSRNLVLGYQPFPWHPPRVGGWRVATGIGQSNHRDHDDAFSVKIMSSIKNGLRQVPYNDYISFKNSNFDHICIKDLDFYNTGSSRNATVLHDQPLGSVFAPSVGDLAYWSIKNRLKMTHDDYIAVSHVKSWQIGIKWI